MKLLDQKSPGRCRKNGGNVFCEIIQTLSEAQRDAVSAEFTLGLGSRIYVDAFKKSGWKDRLNAVDIRNFWEARGLDFPSPSDWATQNDLLTPEALSVQMSDLEQKLKE